MSSRLLLLSALLVLLAILATPVSAGLRGRDCEVCLKVVDKFVEDYKAKKPKNPDAIENNIKKQCATFTNDKEKRFCWYIGAVETSATYILRELSIPISNSIPIDKMCERLKKKDEAVCGLMYEKEQDLSTTDFDKLSVKELKKLLSGWGEECKGCVDKQQFVKKVKEVLPKHNPVAAAAQAKRAAESASKDL